MRIPPALVNSILNDSPHSMIVDERTDMDEVTMYEVPGKNYSAACADKAPRGNRRHLGEVSKKIPEDVDIGRGQVDMTEPRPITVQELINEEMPVEVKVILERGTRAR